MTSEMEMTDSSWQLLSPDEKLEWRLQAWISPPDIKFASPSAEADYKARATRIMDAILLRKTPDRVPVMPSLGGLAAAYCGYTHKDIMYEVDKNIEVATKCTLDFQFDAKIGAGGAGMAQGKVGEILDERLYSWPGHGVKLEVQRTLRRYLNVLIDIIHYIFMGVAAVSGSKSAKAGHDRNTVGRLPQQDGIHDTYCPGFVVRLG